MLDLGCGDLRLGGPLIKKFGGLGIDLSFPCLRRAKHKQCLQADYRKLPLKARFKLIILAFGQICFIPRAELKSFLNNLRRFLDNDGLIYLDLPMPVIFEDMNERNTWDLTEEGLTMWSRQFDPSTEVLSQRRLSFTSSGQIKNDIVFSYQSYSFFELLELFSQIRLKPEYCGEDLEETPIGEESEWMYFLLKKA